MIHMHRDITSNVFSCNFQKLLRVNERPKSKKKNLFMSPSLVSVLFDTPDIGLGTWIFWTQSMVGKNPVELEKYLEKKN
jgi:hypothetical protein